ncbi:MAG: hypothetical protein P9M00_00645 [Candidatus Tritonobacter lacicola]|nr:hypothetical protein [Candidatus Tritonobacter lacicola]
MDERKLKEIKYLKYLRAPPWSRITCRLCSRRESDYVVYVKMKEHRKKGGVKVCGLLFEYDRELPVGTHVELEIVLSEDSERFICYGRIAEVRKPESEGSYRTKFDFMASSDEEANMIARFAGKFH